VHAYRATDSKRLLEVADPCGPEIDAAILAMAKRAAIVVLAYGQLPKPLRTRAAAVVQMLSEAGAALKYRRLANDGTPCHPPSTFRARCSRWIINRPGNNNQ